MNFRQGVYLPVDAVNNVRSNIDGYERKGCENWQKSIEARYPRMPSKDMDEIRKLAYSLFLASPARGVLSTEMARVLLQLYVLDRYTDVKLRAPFAESREAVAEAHRMADRVLKSWARGPVNEDKCDLVKEEGSQLGRPAERGPAGEKEGHMGRVVTEARRITNRVLGSWRKGRKGPANEGDQAVKGGGEHGRVSDQDPAEKEGNQLERVDGSKPARVAPTRSEEEEESELGRVDVSDLEKLYETEPRKTRTNMSTRASRRASSNPP